MCRGALRDRDAAAAVRAAAAAGAGTRRARGPRGDVPARAAQAAELPPLLGPLVHRADAAPALLVRGGPEQPAEQPPGAMAERRPWLQLHGRLPEGTRPLPGAARRGHTEVQ